MRETRQSGSEGGETEPNRSSLPLSPRARHKESLLEKPAVAHRRASPVKLLTTSPRWQTRRPFVAAALPASLVHAVAKRADRLNPKYPMVVILSS